ncbi:MAG: anaerobic ribonucleoside-triphosphate reductase activating protein [Clostridiales bacterium]|jgi:anaerobic ribonucleoside-triphosphate reductase activating protein|nr:anaerobic ribonucleoside-triphosphate reductase activating protein [Clostridiales bacterium]
MIKIAGIVNDAIADGPGLRLAIFTQGCPHRCPGCHNQHTHDSAGGKWIAAEEIFRRIDANPLLDGITLTGGEPFAQAAALAPVAAHARKKKLGVIAYTGYLWEEIAADPGFMALASLCNYIIDGKYDEGLRSLDLCYKGSANQRIIDVKRSLETGSARVLETL